MGTLHLLRHAKSSWDDAAVPDHDRPLAPRGVRAARRIAAHLPSAGVHPAMVLCSSARRARQTLEALRPALGETAEVSIEPELYGADASDLLERLRRVDPRIAEVLVVAHNPGLQDLTIELSGGGNAELLNHLRREVPYGGARDIRRSCQLGRTWPRPGATDAARDVEGPLVNGVAGQAAARVCDAKGRGLLIKLDGPPRGRLTGRDIDSAAPGVRVLSAVESKHATIVVSRSAD